jgi:hypothetical protein
MLVYIIALLLSFSGKLQLTPEQEERVLWIARIEITFELGFFLFKLYNL